jgi:predicted nucleic acid-binding protein
VTPNTAEVVWYADTSALVKLVVDEPETAALRTWLRRTRADLMASDLARTELVRATVRVEPDALVRARLVLEGVTLMDVRTDLCERAGRLDPSVLRSLDALHVAAALDCGDDLEGMLTYDERLAAAATANGIPVEAPR